MSKETTGYERMTVPALRKILKENDIELRPGSYLTLKKDYCEACVIGSLLLANSDDPGYLKYQVIEDEGDIAELAQEVNPQYPYYYIVGLEAGFEGWGDPKEDGMGYGFGDVDFPTDNPDYRKGLADGRRIRRSYNKGSL